MIKINALQDQLAQERILLRSSVHTLERLIADGTNCSEFEANVIAQKAQEVFGLGEYGTDKSLQPGQMVWKAIQIKEPAGKPLQECVFKQIHLTVVNIEEDIRIRDQYGHSSKRQQQILRMTSEAMDQGVLLTQEDLAILLDCDVKTVRTDIKKLQQKHSILVPTRGNIQDIGPGLTHREKAIEHFIRGKDALTIAQEMKHSLKAIERYIVAFCRIIHCQREVKNNLKTALITGYSIALVNKYLTLRDTFMATHAYKERLSEIEEVGSKFWECIDSKKKNGLTARGSR